MCRNTAININFHYRSNSVKMTKFSNKLKKPCFWPISGPFSQFSGKKIFFPETPALSRTTSYEFLAPCQISEITNDTIPRRAGGGTERRKDGRTDRPYFIGPFRLLPGVQKINLNFYFPTPLWCFSAGGGKS